MRVQLAVGFTVAVMAPRHEDPFEGLRLNERFVRGASFLEPSADERGRSSEPASGSTRCQVVPAPRGLPGVFHRMVSPPAPPGRSRRIARMVTFLAIVVGMITITVVALRQTATRGGIGVTTAARAGAATAVGSTPTLRSAVTSGLSEPPAGFTVSAALISSLHRGDCLAWTPLPAGDIEVLRPVVPVRVGCDQPHIDQVTRLVDLAGPDENFPGASTLAQRARQRCAGALRDSTGAIDSAPHLAVGALYPSEPSYAAGVRRGVCTVRPDDLRTRNEPIRVIGSIVT